MKWRKKSLLFLIHLSSNAFMNETFHLFTISDHMFSISKMLDLILISDQKDNLYIKTREPYKWTLDFYITPPSDWVQVTSDPVTYSKDNLLQHLTMLNVLDPYAEENPTDSMKRWEILGPLFGRAGSNLVKNANFTPVYLEAVFEAAFNESVQYLEARAHGMGLYILDPASEYNKTNGKHYIDNADGDLWVTTVQKVLNDFRAKHPEFIGYREIIAGYRRDRLAGVKEQIQITKRLQQKFPDVIRGFDLVSQEDKGYSLLFFIDEFADIEMRGDDVPLYFHTAETNWPDDIITSTHPYDPVGTEQNVYEAVLLGAKRVGHGIGYIHHPYLLEVMKKRGIAIEANPVSNMLLGYVTDQRHHPAITYHRYGIPVVLGSDDPGRMGYDEFTVDWYEAFMGWGIDLADLKQFANNSFQYSTMTTTQGKVAFTKWSTAWTQFISDMKQEACNANLSIDKPEIHRIYPREGSASNETKVRVFGRYFESGICNNIICRFGTVTSKGKYVYNSMITCSAPLTNTNLATVPFSLSLDGGASFIKTNERFSYFHNLHSSDAAVVNVLVG